jgi:hypothetical protein
LKVGCEKVEACEREVVSQNLNHMALTSRQIQKFTLSDEPPQIVRQLKYVFPNYTRGIKGKRCNGCQMDLHQIAFANVDPVRRVAGGYIRGTVAVKFRFDDVADSMKLVLREDTGAGALALPVLILGGGNVSVAAPKKMGAGAGAGAAAGV